MDESLIKKSSSLEKLILSSLFISHFSIYPSQLVITVLLSEIAQEHGVSLGVSAQIRTFSLVVSLVSSLILGVISMRYGHKYLLMAGLIIISISALGCGLSQSYISLIAFYLLTGLGSSIVSPMATTLVGEHFTDKRAWALGWFGAAGGISHMVGSQVVGYLAEISGWRLPFLAYSLPIALLSTIFVKIYLPTKHIKTQKTDEDVFRGYRKVLSDRSAVACLIGIIIAAAMWQGIYFFSVSFLKTELAVSPIFAATIYSIMSLLFTLGSLSSSKIINKIGRKRSVLLGLAVLSIFTVLYTNIPVLSIVMICNILGCFFGAVRNMSSIGLSLEQVPEARGTMMSLNSASQTIGSVLGTGIGGFIIIFYGWSTLGLVFGVLGALSATIYLLYTKDPSRDD